jgi:hypothetical protein
MYSLQGLLALMRPDSGHVCQALIVESNCTPGSAQCHAARQICCQRSLALIVLATLPLVRLVSSQSPSALTALKNSSVSLTELLEFCPLTVW